MTTPLPYSNRELDAKFDSVHEKLNMILEQTTGQRDRINNVEVRNSYVAGGIAVIAIVFLPFLGYIFIQGQGNSNSIAKIQARIPVGISTSLAR